MVAHPTFTAARRRLPKYGYISEHHAFGQNERAAGDYAEDLAASMLATVLGVPFDPAEAWDARREQWQLSGHVVTSQNHTAVAEAPEDGMWVTAASAAVFCG
jgi:arginine decarboxylase